MSKSLVSGFDSCSKLEPQSRHEVLSKSMTQKETGDHDDYRFALFDARSSSCLSLSYHSRTTPSSHYSLHSLLGCHGSEKKLRGENARDIN